MDNVVVNDTFPSQLAKDLRMYATTHQTQGRFDGGYDIIEFWYDSDPLIQQAIQWAQETFPSLKSRPFQQGWFFIYDNWCAGVNVHADPGHLNLNIWLTPDEAIVDSNKNGLVVYDKRAPDDWSWEDYNANQRKIRHFLKDAATQTIAYKYRRAIMFDSTVFHKTNGVHTRRGLANRRVNCTLVFA